MSFKRKRTYGPVAMLEDYGIGRAGSQVYAPYRPPRPLKRRKAFVSGRARIGGYYGRYPVGPRGGELKFFDLDLDEDPFTTAGAITDSINKIAQGVTEVTRVGRKCTIKSVNWRFLIWLPEQDAVADPLAGDSVRIILYIDKQCNGATAAVTDLLETANWRSFRNLANTSRFNVLMDKTTSINFMTLGSDGAGVVSSAQMNKSGTFFKRCNIPLEFDASTGTITEVRSNNLGVLLISSNGTANFSSKIRVRFSDN